MARSAEAIVLNEVEREELDRLVRAHSTPQQLVLRARIIRLAADGIGNRESARRLGVTVQTVRCWRRRWDGEPDLALLDRLADAPRPGTPPIFTPEQICAIVALACEPPDASGVPITHWSQSALAREAIKRGLVETISHGSVGRFLKGGGPPAPSRARLADARPRSGLRHQVRRHLRDLSRRRNGGDGRRAHRFAR
jgi:putative transposase